MPSMFPPGTFLTKVDSHVGSYYLIAPTRKRLLLAQEIAKVRALVAVVPFPLGGTVDPGRSWKIA